LGSACQFRSRGPRLCCLHLQAERAALLKRKTAAMVVVESASRPRPLAGFAPPPLEGWRPAEALAYRDGVRGRAVLLAEPAAGLDEGILSLWLPVLFCMRNPCINNKYQ
jgi:hypothetical protein